MTITAYPKALTGTSEDQWSDFFEHLVGAGASLPASFAPSGDGSGMNVKIAAGFGFVRSVAWRSTAVETVAIGAAPGTAGTSRIDTVVARLDRSGTPVIKLAVLAGTATSGTPVAPTLTQNPTGIWEWPICDVRVNAGVSSIVAGNVTSRRTTVRRPVVVQQAQPPSIAGQPQVWVSW